jgi:hypothetical protein
MKSKIQKKPSVLKREHPAFRNLKFLSFFFQYFLGHFCPPGSESGSTDLIDPDPIRIRTVNEISVPVRSIDPKFFSYTVIKLKIVLWYRGVQQAIPLFLAETGTVGVAGGISRAARVLLVYRAASGGCNSGAAATTTPAGCRTGTRVVNSRAASSSRAVAATRSGGSKT